MILRTARLLAAGSSLALAVAAHAQTPAPVEAQQPAATAAETPTNAAEVEAADEETIIVTGSRIARAGVDTVVPVTVLTGDQLSQTGTVFIGDVLNELPSLRSTYSTGNSTRFIGTAGLAIADLRGLGTQRTLVLQNGKRHVPGVIAGNEVDLNSIPTDLVEAIEIVTGGSSAVYGSDAIAGVINFKLKEDFEGADFRAQSGISSRGDRPAQFLAGVVGTNFAGGRGNIALALEYSNQDPTFAYDRPYFRERQQFNQVQFDTNANSDGIADRQFFTDPTRNLFLSEGGTFLRLVDVNNPATFIARTNANGTIVRVPRIYRFRPDGSLTEADYGTRDLRFGETTPGNFNTGGPTNSIFGDGTNLRRYGNLQPDIDRYSANIIGKFEVTPAFEPYFEAKYVRVDVVQESSPTFAQTGPSAGSFGTGPSTYAANSVGVPIRFDNPYLTDQARTQLRALVGPGADFFRLNRNNLDIGSRGEDTRRETYRGVVGVRGEFNEDWRFDVSANYGQVDVVTDSLNNRLQQRFELAADAIRDPATGQIVCRSRVTAPAPLPTVVDGVFNPVNAAKNAQLAGDIAACVPINLLGEGNVSRAARDYVNTTTRYTGVHRQFVALASLSGDLSQLFELPGGPIGFAVGGEYRRESARASFGEVVSSGLTFLNAIPDFSAPKLEVKEVFGEVNVPLLADLPGFQELTFTGALRYSDYNNATGGVIAWNAGGVWAPFKGLRLRGNYSVSVRAPTLDDLYATATQNFANITDPCDINQINSGAAPRPANCLADNIPVGFINNAARGSSTELLSSGNPLLVEERSKSYTLGGVFTPTFLPGLTISADYYNIEIDDVIASVPAQLIANLCYDAPDLNNVFCANVRRDPVTREFLRPGIIQSTFNFASRDAEGVDAEVNYRTELAPDLSLNAGGKATYVIKRNNFPDVSNPSFRNQILFELGDPEWAFNLDVDIKYKKLTIGYEMRYIGKQVINAAEDIFPSNSTDAVPATDTTPAIPANPGLPQNPDYSDPLFYPEVFYHDFRLDFEASERFSIYGGVDNAFDKDPPLGLGGNGEGSGIYDNVGRFFYVGVKVNL